MAFKQNFEKVEKVVNVEDVSLSKTESNSASFEQLYKVVGEVINTQYNSSLIKSVAPLVQKIIKLDERQMEEFVNAITVESEAFNEKDLIEYKKMEKMIKDKGDKKKAILEYIKMGTATLTFVNAMLGIIKTIMGFSV